MISLKDVDVSVIIPTYKRAEKLGRAIESVLTQTFEKVEVIVVDDNSSGDEFRKDTERTMRKFSDNPKVVYLQHSKNRNGSAARNTGIRCSKSKYIAFLDDDDYFLDSKIEKQVTALERNTSEGHGGICCNRIAKYREHIYDKNAIKINLTGNYLATLLSKEDILAAGSTLMVKREVFDHIGYFDESFQRHQDYEFLIRFFRYYKLLILSEHLVCICVDGIRNYPKANHFHSIKASFFKKFDSDIKKLSKEQRRKIFYNQWSEVFLYYLVERKYSKAKMIYFSKMKRNRTRLDFFLIMKCFYVMAENKINFLLPLKYKLFAFKYLFKSKR